MCMTNGPEQAKYLKYEPLVSQHGIFTVPQAYEMASLEQGKLSWELVGESRARLIFIDNAGTEFDVVMPRTHGFVEVQSIRGIEAHRQKYSEYWDKEPEPKEIKARLRR